MPRSARTLLAAAALLLVQLAGCAEDRPPVVVAAIDSGINACHERFQRAGGIPAAPLADFRDAGAPGEPTPQVVQLAQSGATARPRTSLPAPARTVNP